jgi:hypothetical protein
MRTGPVRYAEPTVREQARKPLSIIGGSSPGRVENVQIVPVFGSV